MTANVLEHRRAKAFAEALEAHQAESRPGSSHHGGSTAMAELLTMAGALGALPEPELSTEVRTVQRAQLMAAFEQAWAGGPAARVPQQRRHRAAGAAQRSRWGRRLAIGGLVAGVAVGSFAGAAAASTNALPGDALYGMKRGLEGLQLDWAGSDTERGALLLDQASTRLEEAQDLLGRAGSPSGLSAGTVEQVRRALDDMHAEAIRGRDLLRSVYRSNGSLAPMRKLAGFADGEDERWAALHGKLPGQLTTQASRVDELFSDISEDVAPLHLEQQPGKGGGPGHGGAGGGQQAPGSTSSPAQGEAQGSADTPNSRGSSGGTAHGGPAPGGAAAGVGSLVNGLTNGLTGSGASSSPAAGQSPKSGDSAAPSAPAQGTPDGQGITIPPLIPGLLPEITLG
ncbi:DUF5667 domain-containing protein [Kitasatospora atroaurantiaca]|uniref:DUF5667 domain-containing protein n=1 Tax=Kitasatospora atroaurantiaca TaxID=285545 RepID=A0A561EQV3_9ACTN|nr:DUF5667 domain-containing protein [Kitasatospora atroaurantiaca]TWE17996.1 hypothetical protein FB465_3043 [Kitasatospora atroaurantiaca]